MSGEKLPPGMTRTTGADGRETLSFDGVAGSLARPHGDSLHVAWGYISGRPLDAEERARLLEYARSMFGIG